MLRRTCVGTLLLALLSGCTAEVGPELSDERLIQSSQDALSGQSWALWMPAPGSVNTDIPVCFEPNSGFNAAEQAEIRAKANAWNGAAWRITFTGWGECLYLPGPRGGTISPPGIHVSRSFECDVDGIGTNISGVKNGLTLIDTQPNCIVHEFGHALGFTHEQERSDNTVCNADQTQSEPDLGMSAFDNNSVMSYCGPGTGVLTNLDVLGARSVYGTSAQSLPYSNFGNTRYAVRANNGDYMRADDSPHDVLADQNHIEVHEKFWIDRVTGSDTVLRYGDRVSFMTFDGYYLRARPEGNNWVVDKSTTRGDTEIWTIVRANNPTSTGGLVFVNDEVAFKSFYGRYLYRGTDENVRAHNVNIQSREKWRLLWLPFSGGVI